MLPQDFIVLILLAIPGQSRSGLNLFDQGQRQLDPHCKALTVRIGLSVFLFLMLMLGHLTGVIQPHASIPTPPASNAFQRRAATEITKALSSSAFVDYRILKPDRRR